VTAAQLLAALKLTGYPVAYRQFKEEQEPPYICFLFIVSADLIADDANYFELSDYDIELYSVDKDPVAEAALEAQLRVTGTVWSKSETYIESQELHEVIYSVRV
jgi:hypothetical protein